MLLLKNIKIIIQHNNNNSPIAPTSYTSHLKRVTISHNNDSSQITPNSLQITPSNSTTSKVKWNLGEKPVLVKVGRTLHHAHLLEKDVASSTCSVRWVTTNELEEVNSSNVIFDPPTKRSRRSTNLVLQEHLKIPELVPKKSPLTITHPPTK